ncbi:MAG: zinc-binding dehydrogenase [Beutenbergiaceae bacterium]
MISTMRGLRLTGDRTATMSDYDVPELAPDDALVRTTMSAICGSDLPHYRKPMAELGNRADTVPGHEAVGVVQELPAGYARLRVGDRVMAYQHTGDGTCAHCLRGEPMFCPDRMTLGNHRHGGNAQYLVTPADSLIAVPDDIEDPLAALIACNFGTGYMGLSKTGAGLGDRVVVIGLGPVGSCVVAAAAAQGCMVIAVDPVAERRELATRLGASHTIDPMAQDPIAEVRSLTGEGAEVVAECSANPVAQQQAMKCVRIQGTVLLLGANNAMEIDPGIDVIRKELRLFGSWVFKPYEIDAVFRAARALPGLRELLTTPFAAQDAPAALAAADAGRPGKALVQWS